jgi:hypothetical protein
MTRHQTAIWTESWSNVAPSQAQKGIRHAVRPSTTWSPRCLLMLRLDAALDLFPFEVECSLQVRSSLQSLREPVNLSHQDQTSQHPQSSQPDADVMSSSVPIEKRSIVSDVRFHQAPDP